MFTSIPGMIFMPRCVQRVQLAHAPMIRCLMILLSIGKRKNVEVECVFVK